MDSFEKQMDVWRKKFYLIQNRKDVNVGDNMERGPIQKEFVFLDRSGQVRTGPTWDIFDRKLDVLDLEPTILQNVDSILYHFVIFSLEKVKNSFHNQNIQ